MRMDDYLRKSGKGRLGLKTYFYTYSSIIYIKLE